MTRLVKRPTSLPSKNLKDFLDATKTDSRLLGPLERYIMAQVDDGSRRTDVLHPSEIIKPDWCLRASYHLLRGAEKPAEKKRLRSEIVFTTGHEIHAKYQRWLFEMGVLTGMFRCRACQHKWWATSPKTCPQDGDDRLIYEEVPVESTAHRIQGKADGLVEGLGAPFVLEIKSIGPGTVRMEQPQLLAEHDGDILKAWRDIKRPFLNHRRQAGLYVELLNMSGHAVEEMVFLYELKATGEAKEFVVRRKPDLVADVLETALDLVYAVEHDRKPACSINRMGTCAKCKPFEKE